MSVNEQFKKTPTPAQDRLKMEAPTTTNDHSKPYSQETLGRAWPLVSSQIAQDLGNEWSPGAGASQMPPKHLVLDRANRDFQPPTHLVIELRRRKEVLLDRANRDFRRVDGIDKLLDLLED